MEEIFRKIGQGIPLSSIEQNELSKFVVNLQGVISQVSGTKNGRSNIDAYEVRAKRGVFSLIDIIRNGVVTGRIDGDISLGEDVTDPTKTAFQVFSTAQTYNGEAMGAGDMLLGDNSAGKPNLLWDASVPALIFRSGVLVLNSMSAGSSMTGRKTVVVESGLSIAYFLETTVNFTAEIRDDGGWHNNSTNPNRITVDKDGTYVPSIMSAWTDTGGTGVWFIRVSIWLNGTDFVGGSMANNDRSAYQKWASFAGAPIEMSSGDYLEVHVEHNYGSPRTINEITFSLLELG